MDPQKLASLDPKLREVYERVMGIQIPSQAVPASRVNKPVSASPSQTQFSPNLEAANSQSSADLQPQSAPQQSSDFTQTNSEMPTPTIPTPDLFPSNPMPAAETLVIPRKNLSLEFILFGIVVFVFIVIYALFWTRVFNLSLPFLSVY